jgi:hypothetical protein
MTRRPGDPSLDDELRETLRRRDPGTAPFELRTRVLDLPERTEPVERSGARRQVAAVLGLAAVILLAVIGLTTIRHLGPAGVSGASVPGSPQPIPSLGPSPAGALDPTLEGPGISATEDFSPAILVVPTCAVLAALAFTIGGRRRIVPGAAALLLAGWAVVGTFAPLTFGNFGFGPGLNTVQATQLPGSQEVLFYELAPGSGRFSIGLGLYAEGPLPVRVEGIVSAPFDHRDQFAGMLWTAIWIDGEPHGGMTGPARPFVPYNMPPNGQAIWLVGRAGACALGSAFQPSNPAAVLGFQGIDSLDLRVSVLGWPRTIHLPLPFRLVEPEPQSCPGPTPGPSGSGGAQ